MRPNLAPDRPDVIAGRSGYAEELGVRRIYPAAGQGGGRDDAPVLPVEMLGERAIERRRCGLHVIVADRPDVAAGDRRRRRECPVGGERARDGAEIGRCGGVAALRS